MNNDQIAPLLALLDFVQHPEKYSEIVINLKSTLDQVNAAIKEQTQGVTIAEYQTSVDKYCLEQLNKTEAAQSQLKVDREDFEQYKRKTLQEFSQLDSDVQLKKQEFQVQKDAFELLRQQIEPRLKELDIMEQRLSDKSSTLSLKEADLNDKADRIKKLLSINN